MDWERAYHILEEYIDWDEHTGEEDRQFLEHRINMCNPVYKILQGCNMETIAKSLKKLKQETGYGVKNGETKKFESKRAKTAKLSKRHIEGVISQSA